MVNHRETKVSKKYEKEGWITIRGGAPDFLFIKGKNNKITDVEFVEVKSKLDKLTWEQMMWRRILQEYFNAHYKLITVEIGWNEKIKSNKNKPIK